MEKPGMSRKWILSGFMGGFWLASDTPPVYASGPGFLQPLAMSWPVNSVSLWRVVDGTSPCIFGTFCSCLEEA